MRLKGRHQNGTIAAGVLFCSLLASGCDRPQDTNRPPPIPSVKTIEVEPQDAAQERSLSGMLIVAEETKLSFSVRGKLIDVPLREGSEFKAGQEIARLDPSDFERELTTQRSRLEVAANPASRRGRHVPATIDARQERHGFARRTIAR